MSQAASLEKAQIIEKALSLGFNQAGITHPAALGDAAQRFQEFLEAKRYGDMTWMTEKVDRRSAPTTLWPEVKSIIMLAMNYGPDYDPMENLNKPDTGNISVYARGRDYHDVVKKRLKELARWMVASFGGELKVFVDTAPVMEKPLAAAAGLGWQGKHTNLVSHQLGSWFFLGAIYTTLDLEADPPHRDRCGRCSACMDACPTNAFPAPYQLDARRCISYLTIEHQGHIAPEFRRAMGNHIYGCDDCLAACPWNKFAQIASEAKLHAKDHLVSPKLTDLAELDDAAFRAFFTASPIKRTGRDRFVRNVLIALGNSGDQSALPTVQALLGDPSPLVRAMSIWALNALDPAMAQQMKQRQHPDPDPDPAVEAEWQAIDN